MLHQSDRIKKIFPIVGFKRDSYLKDILVHHEHNLIFYKQNNICPRVVKNDCNVLTYWEIINLKTITEVSSVPREIFTIKLLE